MQRDPKSATMWLRVRNSVCEHLARVFYVKQPTITKGLVIALFLTTASLLSLSYYVSNVTVNAVVKSPPQPTVQCLLDQNKEKGNGGRSVINDHTSAAQLRIDSKVLVLVETPFTHLAQEIVAILESVRFKYKLEFAGKSLPYLTHLDKGKFGSVIFEKWESYLNMDQWNRELLDKYCREYDVGIIAFAQPPDALINAQARGFPLFVHTKLLLQDFEINAQSKILRLTRAGEISRGPLPGEEWTVFVPNHTTYEPLSFAKLRMHHSRNFNSSSSSSSQELEGISYISAIQDHGGFDGIQRVLFGSGFQFWIHRLLFLDSLSYLSHGKLSIPLERYLLIDIDDIFVGPKGVRMVPADVEALIEAQTRLRNKIEGFHFNLGFSGYFFHNGLEEENKGDDMLIAHRERFWWFGHTFTHAQAHKHTLEKLEEEMVSNQQFAKEKGIPVNQSYAVAPHHSGVFPVHEELYDTWRKVWNIRVTSTEEYPHLRPDRHRRGFIHKDIRVLPRQTCGLFTHNILLDKYPGGPGKLDRSINGGELFQTFLYNPILIFMTHLENYGNDRLALYTFESVVKVLRCWTNLELKTLPPTQLADKYFEMFPDEEDPIWRNPCDDKRHLAIWSSKKNCKRLPSFLVIGPQKTGTTALHTFLLMHPSIQASVSSPTSFEEVQFFSGKNYYKGLDWYMEFFPELANKNKTVRFEKSATYFDSSVVPERAHALLPRAKLICILLQPAKRAYSWYQHMRSHKDPVALQYTFYEVVSADDNSPKALRELKQRCLGPGMYAQHIYQWLDYYPAKQLLILDGEQLKNNPVTIMDKVQHFLRLQPFVDFNERLKFSSRKGFFCQVVNGDHTKCLGRGKGRVYPAMEPDAERLLHNFYRKHNIALSKLLTKMVQPVPEWLAEELGDLNR